MFNELMQMWLEFYNEYEWPLSIFGFLVAFGCVQWVFFKVNAATERALIKKYGSWENVPEDEKYPPMW